MKANARLIAKAPKMLEFLEHVHEIVKSANTKEHAELEEWTSDLLTQIKGE